MDNRPTPFSPEPMEGYTCTWWMLCTKKQAANYARENDGHHVPGLGMCSIVAYSRLDGMVSGIDLSVIGNPRDLRTRNSDGQKLYLIALYTRNA